jgi:hypothetical protein
MHVDITTTELRVLLRVFLIKGLRWLDAIDLQSNSGWTTLHFTLNTPLHPFYRGIYPAAYLGC